MHLGSRPSWQLSWLLAAATFCGCKESQTTSTPPAAVVDPAASFARVVQNLRHYLRQLESDPIAVIENGAYTDIRHSREVTGEKFKPPTEEGGDFRGEITITTRWIYSFRPSTETKEEPSKSNEEDTQLLPSDPSQARGVDSEVEILDPSVIADLPRPTRDPGDLTSNLGMSDADEEVQIFNFIFRDNRWELVPQPLTPVEPGAESSIPIDPNTNRSIEEAVQLALKRQ